MKRVRITSKLIEEVNRVTRKLNKCVRRSGYICVDGGSYWHEGKIYSFYIHDNFVEARVYKLVEEEKVAYEEFLYVAYYYANAKSSEDFKSWERLGIFSVYGECYFSREDFLVYANNLKKIVERVKQVLENDVKCLI